MKLKRTLSALLMLAMLLGTLSIYAFAESSYTKPTTDEVTEKLTETDEGLIYDSDFDGITITPSTKTETQVTTAGFNSDYTYTTGDYFSKISAQDFHMADGCQNLYTDPDDPGKIYWRAWANATDSAKYGSKDSNNNFCVNLDTSKAPRGTDIVISFDMTMYASRLGDNLPVQIVTPNGIAVQILRIHNQGYIKAGDNTTPAVNYQLKNGESTNITAHVKFIASSEADNNGDIVVDLYVNGQLIGENCKTDLSAANQAKIMDETGTATGLAEDFQVSYIRFFHLKGASLKARDGSTTLDPEGQDLVSLDGVRMYYSDECYETVHGTDPHNFICKYTNETTHTGICACGKQSEAEEHTLNAYGICELCQANITGVNVSIDADLAMKYHIFIDDSLLTGGEAITLDVDGDVINSYSKEEGKYVFTYDGIGPHQIAKKLNATLYIGDVKIDSKDNYSIEDYCSELLLAHPNEEKLTALVSDLLFYGKAAAEYKGETPPSVEGFTASSDLPTEADKKMSLTYESENIRVYSAGVHFNVVNKIYFKIKSDTADFTVKINGIDASVTDLGGGYYIVYSGEIAPTAYDEAYEITVTVGDDVVSTATYTVNTYCFNMQNNTEMSSLVKALYNFGKSCVAYAQ